MRIFKNKILLAVILFSFAILTLSLFSECSENGSNPSTGLVPKDKAQGALTDQGEQVYLKYCKLCHGTDGKLGLSGALDLSASMLPKEEVVKIIYEGRKGMASYKEVLSSEQIDLVATYIMKFRSTQ